MSKDNKENMKEVFDKVKVFFKDLDDVITEEFKGNEMVEYLKTKSKSVQVQFEGVKEKVEEVIKNYTTEEIFATEKDNTLVLSLVLSGIVKEDISIEIDENKLLVTLKDKNVSREMKDSWSVSKSNLFYDFSKYEETVIVENTSYKLENGILEITIPRKETSKEKKKITIL